MELQTLELISATRRDGSEAIELTAGQRIKIKVDDVDLLNERCPNGKKFTVSVWITIIETDA